MHGLGGQTASFHDTLSRKYGEDTNTKTEEQAREDIQEIKKNLNKKLTVPDCSLVDPRAANQC